MFIVLTRENKEEKKSKIHLLKKKTQLQCLSSDVVCLLVYDRKLVFGLLQNKSLVFFSLSSKFRV